MTDEARVETEKETGDPRRWVALVVLLVATFMDLLDGNIVTVGLPSIQRDLSALPGETQWMVAAYTLALAVGIITGGRMGDRFGHKRIFLIGIVGFTVASLLCAVAGSAGELVAFRAVQGLFAALMVPQVLAIVHITFARNEVGRVVALYAAVAGLAIVAGPLVGGALVDADLFGLGWRSIFAINVPIGIIAVVAGARLIPSVDRRTGVPLDLRGVGLLLVALLLLLVPLVHGNQLGWPLWSIVLMVASLPVFALFVAHLRSREAAGDMPLVPPALFRVRAFAACVSAQLVFQAAPAALFFVWTLYVQDVLGWSPLHTGLSILPFCVLLTLSGGLSSQVVVPRWGRNGLFAGIALMLMGLAGLAVLTATEGSGLITWHTVVPFALLGAGMGQIVAPLTTFALAGVPPESAGAASGVVNNVLQLGAVVGVAVIGLVYFRVGDPVGAAVGSFVVSGMLLVAAAAVMVAVPRAAASVTAQAVPAGPSV